MEGIKAKFAKTMLYILGGCIVIFGLFCFSASFFLGLVIVALGAFVFTAPRRANKQAINLPATDNHDYNKSLDDTFPDTIDNRTLLTPYTGDIVGLQYYNQKVANKLKHGDTVILKHEPTNKHDKEAVAVYVENEVKIGYLSQDTRIKHDVFLKLSEGIPVLAKVLDRDYYVNYDDDNELVESDNYKLKIVIARYSKKKTS